MRFALRIGSRLLFVASILALTLVFPASARVHADPGCGWECVSYCQTTENFQEEYCAIEFPEMGDDYNSCITDAENADAFCEFLCPPC